ncbi:MAG: hypothetical protein PW788_15475 [Micavibrio sp.]|nr:hypothetical protein [Micavibrio sp.]
MALTNTFAAVAQKIKNVWNKPALAPLTEPLKIIGKTALFPISQFVDGFKDAAENYFKSDEPFAKRLLNEWMSVDRIVTGLTCTFGAGIGGVAAGIITGVTLGASGAGFVSTGLSAIAALGIGVVATPLAIIGTLALAGATVGALALPYGIGSGCVKAYKDYKLQKTTGAVVAAVPALQTQSLDDKQTAAEIFTKVRSLSADVQAPVMKALNESFTAGTRGVADKISLAIDALPDEERRKLVHHLQSKLAAEFAAVAEDNAENATELKRRIKPLETVRFTPKPKVKTA